MTTLEISVTVNNEMYTKHKGEFGCVRKYDQASSEDFILNIDFEIDCKKTADKNKEELKKAIISHNSKIQTIALAEDNDFNNAVMVF